MHPVFGTLMYTEELLAFFLCYGMDSKVTKKSTVDDTVRVNLNSSPQLNAAQDPEGSY